MSNLKFTMAMAAVAAIPWARADEFAWPTSSSDEGVIVLKTSDTASASNSIENGAHWDVPSEESSAHPSSDYHYWVPAGKTIYGTESGTAPTFSGKSLTIEGTFYTGDSNPTIPRLRALSGSVFEFSKARNGIGGGKITIESSAASPVTFRLTRSSGFKSSPAFNGNSSFDSDADAWLIMRCDRLAPLQMFYFAGCDFSHFYGTLKLVHGYNNGDVPVENYLTNQISAATSMPGSYILGKGVTLYLSTASACMNAGNFTAEAGSRIAIKSNVTGPVSTVTNRLTLGSSVDVDYLAATLAKYDNADFALFKMKDMAAQTENLPDLSSINLIGYNYYGLPQLALEDAPEEAGSKTITIRSGRSLCRLTGHAKYEGSNAEISTFTNKALWSTGALPTSSENAHVNYDLHVAKDFETYCFAAGGMILPSSGVLTPCCAVLTVTNLFLVGGTVQVIDKVVSLSNYRRRGMGAITVKGDYMGVYGGTDGKIMTQSSRLLVIDYPIYGNGSLRLNVRGSTSYPYGGIELTQFNTNFTGKALVYSTGNSNTNSANGYRLQMYLNDARNLGGPMPTETFDGITLRGDPILISTNSLCFNQTNRDIFVYDRGRIVMQNATDNTFEVQVPVTYNGELVFGNDYPTAEKANVGKGGGTLVLGGPAKFYDSSTGAAGDTPVADKNKLKMLIGKLRPAAVDAVNGVAVTFGEESEGLEVDYANEALRTTTGFKMTRTGSALTAADGGQIPVSFINMPRNSGSVLDVAVCTVPSEDADTLCATLQAVRVSGFKRPALKVVSNGDGTSTIKADIRPIGFCIGFH